MLSKVDPEPRQEIEVDPDPDPDPERGLKWIWIRPNAVDPGGYGSETLVSAFMFSSMSCNRQGHEEYLQSLTSPEPPGRRVAKPVINPNFRQPNNVHINPKFQKQQVGGEAVLFVVLRYFIPRQGYIFWPFPSPLGGGCLSQLKNREEFEGGLEQGREKGGKRRKKGKE